MATQRPGYSVPLAEFAASLLAQQELAPRASLLAQQVAQFLPGETAVAVYAFDQENPRWLLKATAGEIAHQGEEFEAEAGTLGAVLERKEALLFPITELAREDYAHLNIVRTAQGLGYVPLLAGDTLLGAVEIVSYREPLGEEALAPAMELAEVAAIAFATALAYENERNAQFHSIRRLTELYDIEKVFSSILEMDQLLPIITSKVQEIIDAQAVNLWMVQEEGLLLVQQNGNDPTAEPGLTQTTGEGIAAEVGESGEPLLIDNPEDERLQKRNAGVEEGGIFSCIAVPLMQADNLVGVLEVVNPLDGEPFDDDDLFLLNTLAEATASALHNASLFEAERKVEILETLVQVSREITSTLNLDRVLQAVVNGPGAVIPYERAAVALERRGKFQLSAVSGMAQVAQTDPDVKRLSDLLYWASSLDREIFVTQRGEEIDADREETRAIFRKYFEESGVRGFYALPLLDDEGRVGVLSFESSDPGFLGPAHLEMIKVLAGQVTVAVRNAELYREVPFIGVLEPLLQRKKKFLALEKSRRTAIVGMAAAAVVFLAICPLPMRVEGTATVAARRTAKIQPEVEGTIRRVLAREGERVQKRAVLAEMDDWNYRAALAEAQARYATASAAMNRGLAANDGSEAGIQRLQADYWGSEVQRDQERLEQTKLRSPIDGVVATPRLEDQVGRKLESGDVFGEVVDTSHASVDVAIPEDDVALLQAGEKGVVKLDSFPTRTFRGTVSVVSPMGEASGEDRIFFARVDVPNPDGAVRPGMQGQAKVSVGWHPAGYVLLRRLAMWSWTKLWNWFGW